MMLLSLMYDKYIQVQLNCWDLPNNVVVWPATGYRKSNYNSSTTGIQWLNNFNIPLIQSIEGSKLKQMTI